MTHEDMKSWLDWFEWLSIGIRLGLIKSASALLTIMADRMK